MTAVVFYFQVHQPYRLRRYTFFDIGAREDYFDDELNELVMRRVAERCYLPMGEVLLQAIERTGGRFRCAFSISGTALEQMEAWAPQALERFQQLARTGAVEILCETSHHSLAWIGDREEFAAQIGGQRARTRELFGALPTTFRNTELIVDREIAPWLESQGFEVLLAEGADDLLQRRSPRVPWRPVGCKSLVLLLRDYPLSDDIAFRFSNRQWPAYPLMAETYASWLAEVPSAPFVGLFMDFETFGEHQWAETGILEFMRHLPELVLAHPHLEFATPSEIAARGHPAAPLAIPRAFSWADAERDLTAWIGNPMQNAAHRGLYELLPRVLRAASSGRPDLYRTWKKLSTSDHVYYMCTKFLSDQDVHEYFSPYSTPHEAFVTFMNVLDDFSRRVERVLAGPAASGDLS
jgi:alpha-amylase